VGRRGEETARDIGAVTGLEEAGGSAGAGGFLAESFSLAKDPLLLGGGDRRRRETASLSGFTALVRVRGRLSSSFLSAWSFSGVNDFTGEVTLHVSLVGLLGGGVKSSLLPLGVLVISPLGV